MSKREREIRKLVASAGLTLITLIVGGNSHFKAVLENTHGHRVGYSFPMSASDWRNEKNTLADLRRLARGDLVAFSRNRPLKQHQTKGA